MTAFTRAFQADIFDLLDSGYSSLKMGLYTTPTDIDGGGDESVASGYSRQAISFDMSTAATGIIYNDVAVEFTGMESTETLVAAGIHDGGSPYNMLIYGMLTVAITPIGMAATITFNPGDISISIDYV